MKAVRGSRLLAAALVGALALAGAVFGVAAPASAVTGHISGLVTDGTTPIDGLTVHLFEIDGFNLTHLYQDDTDGTGAYDFGTAPTSGPLLAGDYLVWADGGDDWFSDGYPLFAYDPTSATGGELPDIEVDPAYTISGIVMGLGSPIEHAEVSVDDGGSGFYTNFSPLNPFGTKADGLYRIQVPVTDADYTVIAYAGPGWHEQAWELIDDPACGCGPGPVPDPVLIRSAPKTDIDFDLTPNDLAFDLFVEQETSPGNFDPIDGMVVIVEQLIASTWTEIFRDTSDSGGGFYYSAPLSGDFRVRFEDGSTKTRYMDSYRYPAGPFSTAGGCFATYPAVGPGSYIEVDYGFAGPSFDHSCATTSPPAPPSMGTPRVTRGPGISVSTFISPTATPTPTPTPTSSPSPSSSPSGEPSASPEPTDEPEPTGNALADLWWVWLLLLLILVLIVFFLVRLIRGRS